jgi:hypothetical protein
VVFLPSRLSSLVQATKNPNILLYGIQVIGKGVKKESINWPLVSYLEEIMVNKYIELHLPPLEQRQFQLWSRIRDFNLQADLLPPQPTRQGARRLHRRIVGPPSWPKADPKIEQYELFCRLLRFRGTILVTGKLKRLKDLFEVSGAALKDKMKASDLETRWMAIQVVGTKRLPFQQELIARLSDRSYAVRQAARKALIRISRGNDFGPGPKAKERETAAAIHKWETWWSLQDSNPKLRSLSRAERP